MITRRYKAQQCLFGILVALTALCSNANDDTPKDAAPPITVDKAADTANTPATNNYKVETKMTSRKRFSLSFINPQNCLISEQSRLQNKVIRW
jgi:hypothetical protein